MSAISSALLSSKPPRCQLAGRSRAPAVRMGGCRVRTCRPQTALAAAAYPDPTYIDETLKAFSEGDKTVANSHEAMCLYQDGGYTLLDVRSALAFSNVGKIRGAVNVPIISAKRRFDSETRTNVVTTEELPDFVERMQAKFPDKETKLLVMCATGKKHSISALMALDAAGYMNLVGLKGGYNAWISTWDNNFRRRGNPQYETVYNADGDGMGIHSTGAGFAMVDSVSPFASEDY